MNQRTYYTISGAILLMADGEVVPRQDEMIEIRDGRRFRVTEVVHRQSAGTAMSTEVVVEAA